MVVVVFQRKEAPMPTIPYKRILTIQDISCVGQCSLTVALPILSACGMETSILPSAVLSTHTAPGFEGWTFRDLTDDIPLISAHWKKQGIRFDSIYTGYLGSPRQVAFVRDIMANLSNEGCVKIVDPVLGDHGKLYPGFSQENVDSMIPLCATADIVIPNITEASFLTGAGYREEYDEPYVRDLIARLRSIGARTIVLTGISYDQESTGVVVSENGGYDYYRHELLPVQSHGTGDVFASAFTGAVARGFSPYDAAKIAARFTIRSIEETIGDAGHWYGVKFERAIPCLVDLLAGQAE